MDFKIRKLKTVGLRQNATDPRTMSLRWPELREAVLAFAGFGVLAFAVTVTVLPRPAVTLISLGFALVLRAGGALQGPHARGEGRSGLG